MHYKQRTFTVSVKALDDALGYIEAYGSVFDVTDLGDDVVKRGAFKRTIQNSKSRVAAGKAKYLAPILYQHDPERPIGGWSDLEETDHGLLCKGQLVLTTQLGREVYELIKAGVISEFSIGYDVPKGGSTYNQKTGVRELTELRLWEVSVVTFAMNPEATLVGVKAGRSISGANQTKLTTNIARLRNALDNLETAIEEIESLLPGPDTDEPDGEESQSPKTLDIDALEQKETAPQGQTPARGSESPSTPDVTGESDDLDEALATVKLLRLLSTKK